VPNGQTQTISDAVSGRVTAIAVDPTDSNVAYLGAADGGVWRTLDGGSTWTSIFDSAASLAIGSLAIPATSHTTLYVGTGEGNSSGDSFFGVGLYRIDSANTTATLSGPYNPSGAFTGRSISRILVSPTDADTIFLSTAGGVAG